MDKKEIISEIINGITNFKMIPFLGAGMSKPCKALDWSEIITVLKNELGTATTNYLLVAQEYETRFGRKILIAKLRELCELKTVDSATLDLHIKILAMNPPLIYTTNYDNAIEEAAKQIRRNYKKVVGLKDIIESPHGAKQIIKFHGDFEDVSSIVFTRKDYDLRLQISSHPLDILFRSHILGKSVLFLGYGFGDENIDYIFQKHTELYGIANLPKSYIVSFENDPEKEKQLKQKNVITLHLNSIDEFTTLVNDINAEVFNKAINDQMDDFFKPLPSIVLTKSEFANLQNYVASENYNDEQKHEKIRQTLDSKIMPIDIEDEIATYISDLFCSDSSNHIKEAAMYSLQHIHFKNPQNILSLCFGLLTLTENPKFVLDFNENFGPDAIMVMEKILLDILKESKLVHQTGSMVILGYLDNAMQNNNKLSQRQAERILETLRDFNYEEFGDFGAGYTPENVQRIIDYFLLSHDSSVRARFHNASITRKMPSLSEIHESIMGNIPKNLL